MSTWCIVEGTRQFMIWLLIGMCGLLSMAAMIGLIAVVVSLVRIERKTGGAVDGPHRGTIGDGRL
jgi:hypothetical protein